MWHNRWRIMLKRWFAVGGNKREQVRFDMFHTCSQTSFIRLIFKRSDARTYPTEELSHVDFVVVEIEIIGIIGI